MRSLRFPETMCAKSAASARESIRMMPPRTPPTIAPILELELGHLKSSEAALERKELVVLVPYGIVPEGAGFDSDVLEVPAANTG